MEEETKVPETTEEGTAHTDVSPETSPETTEESQA